MSIRKNFHPDPTPFPPQRKIQDSRCCKIAYCLYRAIFQAKVRPRRIAVVSVTKGRIVILLLVVVTLLFSLVCAAQRTYQTGKLLSVQSPEMPFPMPLPSGQTLALPLHLTYQFEVQQANIVYIGYCGKRDYKAEWRVGDDVQLRLKKDKVYLKRPNGKEFMLEFLLQAKLGPDGKPITILGYKKR